MHRARVDEGGAYLVLFALLVLVLMTMVAIVLDLSALRQDRTANRTNADFAATAGGLDLKGATSGPAVACQTAWEYFLSNTRDVPAAVTAPDCASTFSGLCTNPIPETATSPAVPGSPIRTAVGVAGDYTVRISNPVPNSDPLMTPDAIGSPAQTVSESDDGAQCDRLGVEIIRVRDALFAGVIGVDSQTTTSHSVALATNEGSKGEAVALLVLDPASCNVLTTDGQAKVIVTYHTGYQNNADPSDPTAVPILDPVTGLPVGPHPGYIHVDSSATGGTGNNNCTTSPNRRAVDAGGNNLESQIVAEGVPAGASGAIRMWALSPGQGNTKAYDDGDVTGGRVVPRPTPAPARLTRAPIDHRYNCKKDGIDGVADNADDCPDYAEQLSSGHIDNLRTSLGPSGVPPAATGTWITYPRPGFPDDACATQPSTPPITITGNVWVNCAGGFTINSSVVFSGGNAVFEGGVDVQGGSFSMNAGSSVDRYAVLRSGDLAKGAGSTLTLNQTMVLLNGGRLRSGGGAGPLSWDAPLAGPFEDLAMWSESPAEHVLGGQAALQVEGVFFAPNANPFNFSGQGVDSQAAAQFITRRLVVTGQGTLRMTPDPSRIVILPQSGVKLIR